LRIKETLLEIIHARDYKANVGFSLEDETVTHEWPFQVLRIRSLDHPVKIGKKCPIMLKVTAQGSVVVREFQ